MFNRFLFKLFILTLASWSVAGTAWAQDYVTYQLGYGYDNVVVANIPSGQPKGSLPTLKHYHHNAVVGVNAYTQLNPKWTLGAGTYFSLGRLDFSGSDNVWGIDIFKLHYQVWPKVTIGLHGGISKQFQAHEGYGKQYEYALYYQLTPQTQVGLSERYGDVDEESNGATVPMTLGQYTLTQLFIEQRF